MPRGLAILIWKRSGLRRLESTEETSFEIQATLFPSRAHGIVTIVTVTLGTRSGSSSGQSPFGGRKARNVYYGDA
jgi:hypothetical protein